MEFKSNKSFIKENFLLENKTSEQLYFDYAESMPIIDYQLSVFDSTQHLLGTQIVELDSLPDADGKGGEGKMSSFLQAWHQDDDRVIDIYLGTYYSKVRYTPGIGWQIYDMRLEKVAGEVIDKRP